MTVSGVTENTYTVVLYHLRLGHHCYLHPYIAISCASQSMSCNAGQQGLLSHVKTPAIPPDQL